MPPSLASFLTLGFIAFLFRRDFREKPNITGAIWIPTLWLLIITTRAVTTWLGMFGLSVGGSSLEEGSTIDALVYFGLIIAGLRVLAQRRVHLSEIIRNNRWLTIYLLYCFIAITWSDFPFVAFKRWIKELGHPIMVLVLLTEPNFEESLTRLLKRCSYIIAPVSILWIKYYPEYGRGFSEWTGQAYNTGITENKNSLGWDCLILCFFFVWHLLMTLRREKSKARRDELILCIGFLAMISWLFSIADSKTPLVALFLSLAILLFTGVRWVNRRLVGVYVLAAVAMIVTVEWTIGIYESALEILGRNASLTERTPLWAELRKWGDRNPVFGVGFESFWLGERRETIWETMKWAPSQAHNGYLETYINTGAVGLALLLCLIIATYCKAHRALLHDFDFGRYRYAFLFAILIYNWTEASLYGLHPVWFMFFVLAIDYPRRRADRPQELAEPVHDPRTGPGLAPIQV